MLAVKSLYCIPSAISLARTLPQAFPKQAARYRFSVVVFRSNNLASEVRGAFRRGTRRKNTVQDSGNRIKEASFAPAGETAFTLGRGVVAGASALGLGALCYYGLGLSNEVGAIDKAALWPANVRQRIRDTYLYFGGSIALTAGSALAVVRSPRFLSLMTKNSWLAIGASFAALIGSGIVCRSIPYEPGFGTKQLAWMIHSGIMGAVVAPVALLGGPLLIRAAWYTAGVIGGLSTVAICAPSERFLNIGGPLALCLGGVFVASIGGMFFPPTTALGAGLYSISVYGGLVVFSGFLLYDTQKIIYAAENWPAYSDRKFDPVNQSIGIYLDTMNIFIRLVTILANGGGARRK